jgi:hypothetical protein
MRGTCYQQRCVALGWHGMRCIAVHGCRVINMKPSAIIEVHAVALKPCLLNCCWSACDMVLHVAHIVLYINGKCKGCACALCCTTAGAWCAEAAAGAAAQ